MFKRNSLYRRKTSSLQVLKALMPTSAYQEMIHCVPDWRNYFSYAATVLDTDELSLMAEVARRLGYSFVSNLEHLDVAQGDEADMNLGLTYIDGGDSPAGVVCVDPSRVIKSGRQFEKSQIFLTVWSCLKGVYEQPALVDPVLKKVLDLIISEARGYGAASVKVEDCGVYSFATPDGRVASGEITQSIRLRFLQHLRNLRVPREGACFVIPCVASRQVWVIDDDPDFIKIFSQVMNSRGHQTRSSDNPADLLGSLNEEGVVPDFVAVDLNLGNVSGNDVVRQLRKHKALSNIPIALVSSEGGVEVVREALDSGANLFFSKADDLQVLEAYVDRLGVGS